MNTLRTLKRFFGFGVIHTFVWSLLLGWCAYGQDANEGKWEVDVQNAMKANDFDEALAVVKSKDTEGIDVPLMIRQQLVLGLARAKKGDDANEQIQKMLEIGFSKLEKDTDVAPFMAAVRISTMVPPPSSAQDGTAKWLQRGMETLASKLSQDRLSFAHASLSELLKESYRMQRSGEERDQALARLRAFASESEQLFSKELPDDPGATVMLRIWNDLLQTQAAEDPAAILAKVHALARDRLESSPSAPVVQAYLSAIQFHASMHARTDPDRAEASLLEAQSLIKSITTEDRSIRSSIDAFEKTIERIQATIANSRALLAMVGKPAPAWDAAQWVHGDEVTQESLQGKVVLLDFWAVWCGPCIATFPHLKHLQSEYGQRGFHVIGVTKQYGYQWDEANQKAVRSEEPVPLDTELAMLNTFMDHHQLAHRSMVTPKESTMFNDYLVSGIPHAVVIDKKGMVRLIKIGSGEKNSQEIEAMVRHLLDE